MSGAVLGKQRRERAAATARSARTWAAIVGADDGAHGLDLGHLALQTWVGCGAGGGGHVTPHPTSTTRRAAAATHLDHQRAARQQLNAVPHDEGA